MSASLFDAGAGSAGLRVRVRPGWLGLFDEIFLEEFRRLQDRKGLQLSAGELEVLKGRALDSVYCLLSAVTVGDGFTFNREFMVLGRRNRVVDGLVFFQPEVLVREGVPVEGLQEFWDGHVPRLLRTACVCVLLER